MRGRLFSLVLVVPVLLAWLEGKQVPPGSPPATPAASVSPAAAPSLKPATPAPAASASPAPATSPAPESPATPASPASPAASGSPAPAASPASGRKPSGMPGMATLEGHTFDAETKQPVNKSEILIPELSLETFSKPNGRFAIHKIPVREKTYEIMIIHPGYENLYEKRVLDREERFKFDFYIKRKGY